MIHLYAKSLQSWTNPREHRTPCNNYNVSIVVSMPTSAIAYITSFTLITRNQSASFSNFVSVCVCVRADGLYEIRWIYGHSSPASNALSRSFTPLTTHSHSDCLNSFVFKLSQFRHLIRRSIFLFTCFSLVIELLKKKNRKQITPIRNDYKWIMPIITAIILYGYGDFRSGN